jgi:hypothetical protein
MVAGLRTPAGRRVLLLGVLLAGAWSLGPSCRGQNVLALDAPVDGHLYDDPTPVVAVQARVGSGYDAGAVQVRLDGVDVISALGLVPPFSGAGGVVDVNGTPVTISNFDATGFGLGAHGAELQATASQGGILTRMAGFELTGPLAQAASALVSAGLPDGAQDAGAEGTLVDASLGEPLVGPPVAFPSGGEMRAGFVPVARARGQGGTP